MLKQNKDLLLEIKQLKTENKALAKQNQQIKQKHQVLENNIDQKIQQAIEKATQPLYEQIKHLEEENIRLNNEILRLKTQTNKNSQNSHKPPSTNTHHHRTIIIQNNREKTDNKPGGKKGHKGTTLTIPHNLDQLVKEGKAKKHIVDLTNGAQKYISQWTIDLQMTTVYTEYRLPHPNIPTISYGEDLKATVVLLSNNGLIAEGRLSDFFSDISGGLISLSDATIEKFNYQAAQNVNIEEIKQDLLNGEAMHVDETIMHCVQRLEYDKPVPLVAINSSYDAVIRTHSGATATLYTVNPHKDDVGVVRDNIIPLFCGILVHDHDKKYYKYGELHVACGAHLSRELKGLFELYHIGWADRFRRFYLGLNTYKNMSLSCAPEVLLGFEQAYDTLVCEGEKVLENMRSKCFGFRELRALVKRLRAYKDAYLLFIRDYRAPFTNNLAERDLRPCKTKMKVSGCFRSWRGLVCYARIRSFLSTMSKRGQALLPVVKTLFTKNPNIPR